MRRRSATDEDIDLRWVIALSVAQLISWGSVFYGFALFMTPIETALSLSRAQSSLAFSLALLMEGLCAFHVGRWIDQGHERRVMTMGSLLLALGFAMQAGVTQAWQFYVCWMVLGAGLSATLYPPAFAVLTRRFPTHFRRAIIVLTFLGGLASTVFIPLVAWLMDQLDWRQTSWVLCALHVWVCAPLHALLLRDAPTPSKASRHTSHDQLTGSPDDWRTHLRGQTFWLIASFMVLLMAVTAALPAHLVSLLREAGLNESWALGIPAAIGVLQVVGRVVLLWVEQQLDVHIANRWVPCLIPLGFAILWLSHLSGMGLALAAWLFVLIYGVGNGMFTIVKGTVVAQYVSQAHVGRLNGVMGLPMALARAAAPWFMGALWQPDVGYRDGLWWMFLFASVGVAALWAAQKRTLNAP